MTNVCLAVIYAVSGFVAGGLTARRDATRYLGAGALLALGVVAIQVGDYWAFPLAATGAVVGMVRARSEYRRRWLMYAPGKGAINLIDDVGRRGRESSRAGQRDSER